MAAAAICKWLHGGPKRLGKESKGVGPHRDPSPSRGEGGYHVNVHVHDTALGTGLVPI